VKIAFCTPFKPINHPSVSGDVTIANDLYETLRGLGHEMLPVEYFPAWKIYARPGRWVGAAAAFNHMVRQACGCDCWLTYGSYYKVPDVYGPWASRRLGLPYFLFQASYAPSRGGKLATWAGYRLNKTAMLRADHVFCNRMNDFSGCGKLLPEDRYSYVRPGIPDGLFERDEAARERLRREWNVGDTPVVMSAAMMRAGVKAKGLKWVIETCADLVARGRDLKLVIAGDGPRRGDIEAMARKRLGDRAVFLGMVERDRLGAVFSAGDFFAFPGLEESVGMVYLEAQRCGLPVVATDDEGAPFVVDNGNTGVITPVSREAFTEAVDRLLMDTEFRTKLGAQAIEYVRRSHGADANYREMVQIMETIINRRRESR